MLTLFDLCALQLQALQLSPNNITIASLMYERLPELNRPKILWHLDFYDHPLSGVALYKGNHVYFDIYEDNGWTCIEDLKASELCADCLEFDDYYIMEDSVYYCEPVRYNLFSLTKDQIIQLQQKNQEFCEKVGYHSQHDPSKYRPYVPSATSDEYYRVRANETRYDTDLICKCTADDFIWYHRPHNSSSSNSAAVSSI